MIALYCASRLASGIVGPMPALRVGVPDIVGDAQRVQRHWCRTACSRGRPRLLLPSLSMISTSSASQSGAYATRIQAGRCALCVAARQHHEALVVAVTR